jgi:uncharacterized protein (DUF4415 family)
MSSKPNPELVDDENPEWTEADFQKAKPARDVLPEIVGRKTADEMLRRGLSQEAEPKESITIRLDADVVKHFKTSGRGWQDKINEALRQWISEHALERNER